MRLAFGAIFAFALTLSVARAGDGEAIDFDRQIRPLLSDNCFSCHGPDAAERQADLRLDRREDAVAQGAIDEAKPAESSLLARILSTDPDTMMPPPKSNKRLTDAQKELIARWIRQGAKYSQHWSFTPPHRPEVPAGAQPIDFLVEQALRREGLSFSPQADPATLARRLALDLVGLPPTEEQVAALASDPSPAGVNRLIEE
ncbi:MAG: c-type cytochrome domain-containing protein, partial [Aureliella sp.]